MQEIFIIAAVANNGIIGSNNQLIWRLPADLKHFKELTLGHTIIMGRKTFESIGKPLPGRKSIIITRDTNYQHENCIVVHSIEEALKCAESKQVFIIGGAEIYKQCIGIATKLFLTHVHSSFEGDAYFPSISAENWQIEDTKAFEADEKNPYPYSFVSYSRK